MKLPNIIIVGRSGTGKTSSLRNLDPNRTGIINCERKVLPFKDASKFTFDIEVSNSQQLASAWTTLNNNPDIDVIILDSFTSRQEQILSLCRNMYKGFDIWSNHNKMIAEELSIMKTSTKFVVWTSIDEIVTIDNPSGSTISMRAVKVDGKEWAGKIEKEFVICLFTDVRSINNKIEYRFMTNTDGVTSAKTPMGMFPEQFITNDLNLVISKCREYYDITNREPKEETIKAKI